MFLIVAIHSFDRTHIKITVPSVGLHPPHITRDYIQLCLRVSSDFVKALAMGADAVAIGTSALIATACQQYRICDTGKCPVGVTTQDPKLRKRLKIDISAKKLENFLYVCTNELKDFARLTGYDDVHKLNIKNLCTTNSEISNHTDIDHV